MISCGKSALALVLFTGTFPYGIIVEKFLETELPYLAARFRRVIIVPRHIHRLQRPVPDGVKIDTSLAQYGSAHWTGRIIEYGLTCVGSRFFYRELITRPLTLMQWKALRRVVGYLGYATRVHRWLLSYIERSDINIKETLFYTYWLGPQSLGIRLAKAKYPEIKLISRAHGGDIYEDRHVPPYLPFRERTLQLIDRVFTVSEHAKQYLAERYPSAGARCEVSRLGVTDCGFSASPSADNIFRIVSCSSLVPVKRLNLLIEGLRAFAQLRPELLIEWHHIGEGPLRRHLEDIAGSILPPTVRGCFYGRIDGEVTEFYSTHPVDAFVNVSRSEGIPVSIMEAQSCGIPVIATAVGGTPEMVNEENGLLLESNPTPQSIAGALEKLAMHRGETFAKRDASKQTWQSMYNAEKNYNDFLNRIMGLFNGTQPVDSIDVRYRRCSGSAEES